jgi:RHS repeat-associated protein
MRGSVRHVAQTNGTILDALTYDWYANILTETNSANGDRFKFTGREWDSEIGLQFNGTRYYDPAIGRWTSQDPLKFDAGDTNLFRYIRNNALVSIDPSGEDPNVLVLYDQNDRGVKDWSLWGRLQFWNYLIVANGKNFDLYARHYNRIPIDGEDFSWTLATIELYVKDHGLIDELRFYDHGGPGSQKVGKAHLEELLDQYGNDLNQFLAPGAKIGLYGCSVCGEGNTTLPKKIFEKMPNVEAVKASTGNVIWSVTASWIVKDPIMPTVTYHNPNRQP